MFINYRQEQWPDWLGIAEFAYNNKTHSSTKVSPFKANYGQDPRMGFEMRRKRKRSREIHNKNKRDPGESKSSTGKSTRGDEEIYR